MSEINNNSVFAFIGDLRGILIRSLAAMSILMVPLYIVSPYVMHFLLNTFFNSVAPKAYYFAPLEVFLLQLKIAFVMDFALCFPVFIRRLWKLAVAPFYKPESSAVSLICLLSFLLFAGGFALGLGILMPFVIRFGISFSGSGLYPLFGVSAVISMSLGLSLVLGLMFQFPLLLYMAVSSGITTIEAIRRRRPYMFIIILILAAVLTPPDIISQLLLAVPTYLFLEISIIVLSLKFRKKKRIFA